MTTPSDAGRALQALRKTKRGNPAPVGRRPRTKPPKPVRTQPFDRAAHLARARAAKAAKKAGE